MPFDNVYAAALSELADIREAASLNDAFTHYPWCLQFTARVFGKGVDEVICDLHEWLAP